MGALGKYEWLASAAIDFGFPVIGAALGVPAIAPMAATMLKKALGMADSASLDTVRNTIEADPEGAKEAMAAANTEASAKWEYLARAAEARAEVDKANVSEINKTIRAETGNVPWWHWRHLIGYVVLLYALQQIALLAYCAYGKGLPADQLATLFNSTTVLTGGLLALLGYVASDNTAMKQTAITGKAPEGVISASIKAIRSK